MTLLSNLHGRVLEYLVVEELVKVQPNTILSSRAKSAQARDMDKLLKIDSTLLKQFHWATQALLVKWLNPQFTISQQAHIIVDRLPDQNQTDVTDIRLILPTSNINLSIKHNHTALRHQRPGTTPIHCGYLRKSVEMKQFQKQYKTITQSFISEIGQVKRFAELSRDLVEQSLYTPVCDLVAQFINTNSQACAPSLFGYLTGSKQYYKIILDTRIQQLEIQHFAAIQMPTDLVAKVEKQYVKLIFNNGWQISMRLHTASSCIGTSPSLKFDTKALVSSIPSTIVFYP